MATKYPEHSVLHVFRYMLASADMYYSEVEQRDVFLGNDEKGNFGIWGQTTNAGPTAKIDLCEVFLEYGLYCCSWCGAAERLYVMQDFGERLGHSIARFLRENPPLLEAPNAAIRALEIVFRTAGACFSAEETEEGMHFTVTECPLEKASRRAGLPHIELAYHGINTMCRSLIHDINPDLIVTASSGTRPEFMLRLAAPEVVH